jgi:hypothetical protein
LLISIHFTTSKHRVQPKDQPVPAAVVGAVADHNPVEAVARIPVAGAADAAEDQVAEVAAHIHEAAYSAVDHTDSDLGFGLVEERSIGFAGRVGR